MAEVQAHGNYFEDLKIRELTGYSKEDYDSFKNNGYTSSMDIVKGLYYYKDVSIKTTNGNKVDCGDILRRMSEKEYEVCLLYTSDAADE